MKPNIDKITADKIWIFPLLFGIVGGLFGLILRYAFTGALAGFSMVSASHFFLFTFSILWSLFCLDVNRFVGKGWNFFSKKTILSLCHKFDFVVSTFIRF